MKDLGLLFMGVVLGIALMILTRKEYELELVDQDTIEIKSNITGRTYTTSYDSIQYQLEIDNL